MMKTPATIGITIFRCHLPVRVDFRGGAICDCATDAAWDDRLGPPEVYRFGDDGKGAVRTLCGDKEED